MHLRISFLAISAAVPGTVAAAGFLVVAILYAASSWAVPASLLALWGFKPYAFPFLDTDTVLSALRCLRMGVDVFTTNPCDSLGRVYDYSPAWLVLARLPVTLAWTKPVGFAVDVLFLLSLFLLPPGRNRLATALIVLGVLSTPVVYALERGNNDLIIFALAIAAAALCEKRARWRWLGYSCAFLGGLLKYYPMLVMTLALREGPRMFVTILCVSLVILVTFVGVEWVPLQRALALIPKGPLFGDMFGAQTLSAGIVEQFDLSSSFARWGEAVMVFTSFGAAITFGLRLSLAEDLARLSERERTALLAGSMLVIGCFLTAQNIGYRAIHLLMALPAMVTLVSVGSARRFYALNTTLLLLLLWTEAWRHWIDALIERRAPWKLTELSLENTARLPAWLLRECLWWWIITLLLALSISLLWRSAVALAVRRRAVGFSWSI